jgi:hypothetical protein
LRGTITGNLSITSAAGNDDVLVPSSLTVTGTSTFKFGNGKSTMNFQSSGTLNFGGAMSITSGDGDDQFLINSPNAMALKAITINWGLGDSLTEFNGTTVTMEALSITGNFGDHKVHFLGSSVSTKNVTLNFKGRDNQIQVDGDATNMTITGNLSIAVSNGTSVFGFDHPLNVTGTTTATLGSGDDSLLFTGGGTLTGGVSVTGNAGKDTVSLTGMTVAGNLTANLGTGNDQVNIDNSILKGTVTLTLGAGADQVNIEQQNVGTETRFEKAVTINADAGADLIKVGLDADANDFARFLLGFTINGGIGLDEARYKNGAQGGTRNNVFSVAPALNSVEVQT